MLNSVVGGMVSWRGTRLATDRVEKGHGQTPYLERLHVLNIFFRRARCIRVGVIEPESTGSKVTIR